MKVLVTGGAGYIGSQTCKVLSRRGFQPIVLDNLSTGHVWAVQWGPLLQADILETAKVESLLRQEKIEAVIHLAGAAIVEESQKDPMKYYNTNVLGTLSLLKAMRQVGVLKLVFSSSCSIYGDVGNLPVDEDRLPKPLSVYGKSKLMAEELISDWCRFGGRGMALRYFNAAGADLDLETGEDHVVETRLIPSAIDAALGRRPPLVVFGLDYSTPDGSALRDYVHILDLAEAHVLALENLHGPGLKAYNLGTEAGFSVRQVISEVERATGQTVPWRAGPRRDGDPESAIACSQRARRELGWNPSSSNLQTMVKTALAWRLRHSS